MHPRRYVLSFFAIVVGAMLCVVGANLIIDPQGVFGTGLFGRHVNINDRYSQFVGYRAALDQYDGLLFGSSRTTGIPTEDLPQPLKGVNVWRYALPGGGLTDFLPVLEFALREKAARGGRLRRVILLLDIDQIGAEPPTNRFIQQFQPPALTGEGAMRFWSKNILAIQFKAWRETLRQASNVRPAPDQPLIPIPMPIPTAPVRHVIDTPFFVQNEELLARFVAQCRLHNVDLVVATMPLSRPNLSRYNSADLAKATDVLSRIVPLWDFSGADWWSDRPDLWTDASHFKPEVGRMMFARIFGDATPPEWAHFGRLVRPPSTATAP
jgi:hypothetical protein